MTFRFNRKSKRWHLWQKFINGDEGFRPLPHGIRPSHVVRGLFDLGEARVEPHWVSIDAMIHERLRDHANAEDKQIRETVEGFVLDHLEEVGA